MTVDRRDQQRAGVIRGTELIDVCAAVEQRERGFGMAFTRRENQRRQAALRADQIGVAKWFWFVARVVITAAAPRLRRRFRASAGLGRGLALDFGDSRVPRPAF
jgi:hypothetical protein